MLKQQQQQKWNEFREVWKGVQDPRGNAVTEMAKNIEHSVLFTLSVLCSSVWKKEMVEEEVVHSANRHVILTDCGMGVK